MVANLQKVKGQSLSGFPPSAMVSQQMTASDVANISASAPD
jgi:hypothetical protein